MLTESLRLLQQVAAVDKASSGTLRCEEIPIIERDSWRALDTFLAYAYAWQGAPSAYAYAARKTVQGLAERRASWQETDLAQQAWQRYKDELKDRAPNHGHNPMCPRRTRYSTKKGDHATQQPSVIEFVQENLSSTEYNIVRWAEKMLRADDVQSAYDRLISINGVGAKIASLFLHDIAWLCDIFPTQSRERLQPVDVWVRRYVHHWAQNSGLSETECARWIVEQSSKAGFSPEKVNAGMWYFGARVAGDALTLSKLIDDAEAMRNAIEKHVNEMAAQVAAWRAETKGV